MKNLFKWIAVLFTVESIAYFFHSFKLGRIVSGIKNGTYFKDGDGIGIYFMGTEINDRVPWNEIYIYRDSFLKKGFLMLIIGATFYLFHRKMKQGIKSTKYKNI
jgi:hypothetical protein